MVDERRHEAAEPVGVPGVQIDLILCASQDAAPSPDLPSIRIDVYALVKVILDRGDVPFGVCLAAENSACAIGHRGRATWQAASTGRAESMPSNSSGSSSRERNLADLGEDGDQPFMERIHGTRYYG
jgi:hypothetical protein